MQQKQAGIQCREIRADVFWGIRQTERENLWKNAPNRHHGSSLRSVGRKERVTDLNGRHLCRAKRLDNGEWVEGYYFCMVHDDGRHIHHFIMPIGVDLSLGTPIEKIQIEIDPITVCLYTGKEYMDCDKAFEGDIIESQSCGVVMVIKYGTYEAYCPADRCFMDNVGFYAEAAGYPQMPIGDLKDYALKIGNIFDNPELLDEDL